MAMLCPRLGVILRGKICKRLLGQLTILEYAYYISVKFPKAANCTVSDYVREFPYL